MFIVDSSSVAQLRTRKTLVNRFDPEGTNSSSRQMHCYTSQMVNIGPPSWSLTIYGPRTRDIAAEKGA